jgi:hypothetical protein
MNDFPGHHPAITRSSPQTMSSSATFGLDERAVMMLMNVHCILLH